MIDSPILPIIRQHFPQIMEKQLQNAIAEVGSLHHFKAEEVIMDFGNYVRMVPLVIKGSIKVMRENEDGREILLYYLKSGETCSMSFTCCMMDKKSIIRTVAEKDATIIGIPIKYMDLWMSQFKSWKNFVMMSYDNRMLELVKVVDSIAFKQIDMRLWEYLESKANATQSNIIHGTHQAIANDLNTSRETISRLLKQLEKMERVKLRRNQIEILLIITDCVDT